MDKSNFKKNTWGQQLIVKLEEIGAPKFLTKIGIDFDLNFFAAITNASNEVNPYLENVWEVWPHSLITDGVLHCYPRVVSNKKVIWEEWFLLNGEIHHHILSNLPFSTEQGVWTPERHDKDHPAAVIRNSWHYENSAILMPSLLIFK